jgi:hypothetical protein
MSADPTWTQEQRDAHFMELADVPFYKPLLGADLTEAATWVNAQPDRAKVEIVRDFMRDRALKLIGAFPWAQARTRTPVERSP